MQPQNCSLYSVQPSTTLSQKHTVHAVMSHLLTIHIIIILESKSRYPISIIDGIQNQKLCMIWHHVPLTHPTKKTFQNNIRDPMGIIANL
jgi:hypothetical protein